MFAITLQKHPENLLLPRSTGLLFALRSLAPQLSDFWLVDATMAYPGVPRGPVGQDYYTLRSIFMQGQPPPKVHLHLRFTRITSATGEITSAIPLGSIDIHTPGLARLTDVSEAERKSR